MGVYIKKGLKEGIVDPGAEHYEDEFEFPLWKLIQERAEEKDISYSAAALEVTPEYCKTIRYRDEDWNDEWIAKSINGII